jgi:hypothetical protein
VGYKLTTDEIVSDPTPHDVLASTDSTLALASPSSSPVQVPSDAGETRSYPLVKTGVLVSTPTVFTGDTTTTRTVEAQSLQEALIHKSPVSRPLEFQMLQGEQPEECPPSSSHLPISTLPCAGVAYSPSHATGQPIVTTTSQSPSPVFFAPAVADSVLLNHLLNRATPDPAHPFVPSSAPSTSGVATAWPHSPLDDREDAMDTSDDFAPRVVGTLNNTLDSGQSSRVLEKPYESRRTCPTNNQLVDPSKQSPSTTEWRVYSSNRRVRRMYVVLL